MKKRSVRSSRGSKLFAYGLIGWMVFISLLPLVWIALTSIKPGDVLTSFDPVFVFAPTFENYFGLFKDGWDSAFIGAFVNSVVIAVLSTVAAVALSIMAAYSLARLQPRGHKQWMMYIFTLRMLPPVALIIPLYVIVQNFNLFDTQVGLMVPYMALAIPLGVWILYGFFLDLPKELEEAALVDGSSRFQAFYRIVLPLTGPGIAAVSIFTFSLAWNDLVLALVLTRKNITLPVLASMVRTDQGIMWGELGALTVLLMLPMIVFTLFVQRWIVSGLAGGAVKG